MKTYSIAILIYGEINSSRNALTEEKYKGLVTAFTEKGFQVDSIIYNDLLTERLAKELCHYDGILVWVNPIERGNNRKILDALLLELSLKGCFVSTHPEVIKKIGTKDILHKIRHLDFGGNTRLYKTHESLSSQMPVVHWEYVF